MAIGGGEYGFLEWLKMHLVHVHRFASVVTQCIEQEKVGCREAIGEALLAETRGPFKVRLMKVIPEDPPVQFVQLIEIGIIEAKVIATVNGDASDAWDFCAQDNRVNTSGQGERN